MRNFFSCLSTSVSGQDQERNHARSASMSSRLMRPVCAFALGATAMFAAPSALSGELSNQTLSVSFAVAPPFVTLKKNVKTPEGVDVSLVKELQRRTGFRLDADGFDLTSFTSMMELGRSGHSDIVAGAISATPERAKYYLISKPYVYNSAVIVSRQGDNIEDLDAMSGRTLAVQTGSNMGAMIGNRAINTYEAPTNFMVFYAVSRGLADALIVDEIIAREYLAIWPEANLQVSGHIEGSESGMALFFKKDSPRSEVLYKTFNEMIDDGTVARIVRDELHNYFEAEEGHEAEQHAHGAGPKLSMSN